MRKLRLFGVAVVAVLAVSAMAASAASAKEWLLNGAAIATATASVTEGELLLVDMASNTEILCSGKFIGTVGPGAKDEITLVEDLKGDDPELDCEWIKVAPCELVAAKELVIVEPVNLPWKTEILLEPTPVDDLLNAGYQVSCKVLGITLKNKCVGTGVADLENLATDVAGKFLEAVKQGECSADKGEALLIGEGLTSVAGSTLQIS
jgi:hypothetical protein